MSSPQTTPPQPPPAPAGWGPVIITAREVYDAVVRVSSQLTTIQAQLAQHTYEHETRDRDIDARFQDHEARLRTQEKARWPLPAVGTVLAIGSLVVAVVSLMR